jgi:hypothetical protein
MIEPSFIIFFGRVGAAKNPACARSEGCGKPSVEKVAARSRLAYHSKTLRKIQALQPVDKFPFRFRLWKNNRHLLYPSLLLSTRFMIPPNPVICFLIFCHTKKTFAAPGDL